MSDLFADRLGNVTVASGVVRLDFLRLKEVNDDTKEGTLEPSMRLVMPMDGLMQTIEVLDAMKEQILQQVEQKNIK